jgi:hypothetical protein
MHRSPEDVVVPLLVDGHGRGQGNREAVVSPSSSDRARVLPGSVTIDGGGAVLDGT